MFFSVPPRDLEVVLIPGSTGSNIGDMTEVSGLAACFDGDSDEPIAESARVTAASGNVGKNYGSNRDIKRWRAWGTSDFGFNNPASNGTATIKLQRYNGGAWSDVDSVSTSAVPGAVDRTLAAFSTDSQFRVFIDGNGAGTVQCAEVEFYELA